MSLKLKYYLRGLGIGVAVTALFFSISGIKPEMTDEEVIERAKKLGMTERTVLADFVAQDSEEATEEESAEYSTKVPEEESTIEGSAEEETIGSEEESTEAVEEETISNEEASITSFAVVQVVRGDSSVTVSRKLADVGLIENAEQFDKYLCKIRYDKKIRTGTFEIQMGASEEDIAKILTGEL